MTLAFRSDSGRRYLYDDVTAVIFQWSDLREALLCLLLNGPDEQVRTGLVARYGIKQVEAAERFLEFWYREYGAFVRRGEDEELVACPPAEELEQYIRRNSFELLLILTEDCNLRCRYCGLSALYPLNRPKSSQRMSVETARSALDWYAKLIAPQLDRNPRKQFGLSLYGGEPTMNLPVLQAILHYCCRRYEGLFVPVISTNGTLLTAQVVDLLVEHDVTLAVSIDGPEAEHDRLRVDGQNRGSFARIMDNLAAIREKHPEYWATKVRCLSVYDPGTDVEVVERFFAAPESGMPPSLFVNQVNAHNTNWYDRYGAEQRDRLAHALARLRQRYKEAKIEGETVSSYMMSLVGLDICMALVRRRAGDPRPEFIPFSSTCLPGEKVAVHPDGQLDICERVNGTYPIGHLAQGGIDYGRLQQIIDRYRQQVLYACPNCPATKQCGLCFSYVEGDSDLNRIDSLCERIVEGARERLSDYVSIMEANPHADFNFETDTARLEERLLFLR